MRTDPCRLCGRSCNPDFEVELPVADECRRAVTEREHLWDHPASQPRRELGSVVRADRDCICVSWVFHDGEFKGRLIPAPPRWIWVNTWWAVHGVSGEFRRAFTLRGALRLHPRRGRHNQRHRRESELSR